ncbi:uncharacterized protein LOC100185326 [Ciona intestinalis]
MPPVITSFSDAKNKGTELIPLEQNNNESSRKLSIPASESSNLGSRSRSHSTQSNSESVASSSPSPGPSPRRSKRPAPGATLLEKAMYFRRTCPEKWARLEELAAKETREALLNQYERSPYLETYYESLEAARLELQRQEALERSMPPRMHVRIQFNPTKQFDCESKNEDKCSTYSTNSGILGFFSSDKKSEEEAELVVDVTKGTNMLNNFKDDEDDRIIRSKVKCYLNPDKQGSMKTSNQYLSRNGKSRWRHTFVFRGITVEELTAKSIVFEVKGSNNDRKVILGKATLAGQKAILTAEEYQSREVEHALQQALDKPGEQIKAVLEVREPVNNESKLRRGRSIRRK